MSALPVPYYSDDLVTIYHGDMLDILPKLGEFPFIFTSPPYNLGEKPWAGFGHWTVGQKQTHRSMWKRTTRDHGIGYDGHEDSMPWAEYEAWQKQCLRVMWDALPEDGAIFYNHKQRVIGGRLWKPDSMIEDPLILRQEIVWERAGGINFNAAAYASFSERIYVIAKIPWRLDSRGHPLLGTYGVSPKNRLTILHRSHRNSLGMPSKQSNLTWHSTRSVVQVPHSVLLLIVVFVVSGLTGPNGIARWRSIGLLRAR